MIADTVTIRHDKWLALVCPRLGANVIKLTYEGRDVLRPLNDEAELKINPYLQGAPILMPANRTYKGKFTFEGKEYTLPLNEPQNDCNLHGSVLYQSFQTLSVTENEAVMRLTDTNGESYPFPFELTVRYTLSEQGLLSEYSVKNIGKGNMPLTFALHTTFVEPDEFTIPIDLCQEKDAHHVPTGRYIELDDQQKRYVTGSPSSGINITGYFRSCGNVARIGDYLYTVSDNFDHWITFNGQGKRGLLCIEPQSGRVNALNGPFDEGSYRLLSPGEDITFKTLISEK